MSLQFLPRTVSALALATMAAFTVKIPFASLSPLSPTTYPSPPPFSLTPPPAPHITNIIHHHHHHRHHHHYHHYTIQASPNLWPIYIGFGCVVLSLWIVFFFRPSRCCNRFRSPPQVADSPNVKSAVLLLDIAKEGSSKNPTLQSALICNSVVGRATFWAYVLRLALSPSGIDVISTSIEQGPAAANTITLGLGVMILVTAYIHDQVSRLIVGHFSKPSDDNDTTLCPTPSPFRKGKWVFIQERCDSSPIPRRPEDDSPHEMEPLLPDPQNKDCCSSEGSTVGAESKNDETESTLDTWLDEINVGSERFSIDSMDSFHLSSHLYSPLDVISAWGSPDEDSAGAALIDTSGDDLPRVLFPFAIQPPPSPPSPPRRKTSGVSTPPDSPAPLAAESEGTPSVHYPSNAANVKNLSPRSPSKILDAPIHTSMSPSRSSSLLEDVHSASISPPVSPPSPSRPPWLSFFKIQNSPLEDETLPISDLRFAGLDVLLDARGTHRMVDDLEDVSTDTSGGSLSSIPAFRPLSTSPVTLTPLTMVIGGASTPASDIVQPSPIAQIPAVDLSCSFTPLPPPSPSAGHNSSVEEEEESFGLTSVVVATTDLLANVENASRRTTELLQVARRLWGYPAPNSVASPPSTPPPGINLIPPSPASCSNPPPFAHPHHIPKFIRSASFPSPSPTLSRQSIRAAQANAVAGSSNISSCFTLEDRTGELSVEMDIGAPEVLFDACHDSEILGFLLLLDQSDEWEATDDMQRFWLQRKAAKLKEQESQVGNTDSSTLATAASASDGSSPSTFRSLSPPPSRPMPPIPPRRPQPEHKPGIRPSILALCDSAPPRHSPRGG